MNALGNSDISEAIWEIRDLLRLLAEPAIATRDSKRRDELRRIVGSSPAKTKAVMLMDGTRTQTDIHKLSGCQKSHLSVLVKQLLNSDLITGEPKQPKLALSIPETFFEENHE